MDRKQMRSIPQRSILLALLSILVITPDVFAEQNGAQKKPRRVTNRHLTKVAEAQVNPAQDYAQDETSVQEDADAQEQAEIDNWGSGDSEVVLAGCKNCQSNSAGPQSYESEIGPEETYVESDSEFVQPQYRARRGAGVDLLGFSCDGNSCGGQTPGDCYRIEINPCSPLGLLLNRLSIRTEHGFFWGNGQQLPVLVRNNNDALFGGGETGAGSVSGVRSDINLWLDDYKSQSVLVRMFYGGENDTGLSTDSTQFDNLNIPYIIALNDVENSALIADLPALTGNVNANLSSNIYGGDLLLKKMISRDNLGRWDFLMGYQTARLSESLVIESFRSTVAAVPDTNFVRDSFSVKNQFHGVTFGMSGDVREGNWYFGGLFKLGLGNMERIVNIQGTQTTTVANVPDVKDSGLFASARSNSGRYSLDTFVVSPELNLTAGYRLTPALDFTIGYNMLHLPKVTRVTNALDPEMKVDDQPVPTLLNPAFVFSESNFTLHSLNLGLQWNY